MGALYFGSPILLVVIIYLAYDVGYQRGYRKGVFAMQRPGVELPENPTEIRKAS